RRQGVRGHAPMSQRGGCSVAANELPIAERRWRRIAHFLKYTVRRIDAATQVPGVNRRAHARTLRRLGDPDRSGKRLRTPNFPVARLATARRASATATRSPCAVPAVLARQTGRSRARRNTILTGEPARLRRENAS